MKSDRKYKLMYNEIMYNLQELLAHEVYTYDLFIDE